MSALVQACQDSAISRRESGDTVEHTCWNGQELAFFLRVAGLELLSLTAMPAQNVPADEATWKVLVVARAV
jgi:hypothetical protein